MKSVELTTRILTFLREKANVSYNACKNLITSHFPYQLSQGSHIRVTTAETVMEKSMFMASTVRILTS